MRKNCEQKETLYLNIYNIKNRFWFYLCRVRKGIDMIKPYSSVL